LDRYAIFEAWAPRDGVWTPWAKPVLFAHAEQGNAESGEAQRATWIRMDLVSPARSAGYRTSPLEPTAIVIDLPGVAGVAAGLALADLGFRPVPLYTALPSDQAVVPMFEVVRVLVAASAELVRLRLPPEAPPAFLLDARRFGPRYGARPGQFDNRSVALPADFPSGEMLARAGIRTVILIQRGEGPPSTDLELPLAVWEQSGLRLFTVSDSPPHAMLPLHVPKPGVFARIAMWWERSLLRRQRAGGFGRWIPSESQHG
jgi:hypothetical protein